MASLLSLPDDVIDIIGTATEERVGIKAWCMLTSTCTRLWKMQLPQSRRGWQLPSQLDIEGVAWVLQRLQAAPWLAFQLLDLSSRWTLDKNGPPAAEIVNNLQKHLEVATAASRGLDKLKLLDVAITINEDKLPKRLACRLPQWKLALLWGARNLEALTICIFPNAAPCPPVLGCLPKLRFLELTLYNADKGRQGIRLGTLFDDLSFCYSLEALSINVPEISYDYVLCRWARAASKLPDVQLSALPNLKRVELVNWLPTAEFGLPPDCELSVMAHPEPNEWCFKEQWEAMERHLKFLSLADKGDPDLLTWKDGFERLSRLQCFCYESEGSLTMDLADLKAVPHVRVFIKGKGSLTLTDGTWQTLQVHGMGGLCIRFSDADAFVRGTQRFLFSSSGSRAVSQLMCASIREACSRQLRSCYRCCYIWQSLALEVDPYTVRLSNCEEAMRLEPLHDEKITPSGGLHDGYAGTPEDSPLWQRLSQKSLVYLDEFWPGWKPHEWVFGE